MQFIFTDPQTEFERMIGGYTYANVFGSIEPGDDDRFTEFLIRSDVPARTVVYIDSAGGDVDAAIGIGRTIRERWMETTVGRCLLKHDQSSSFILTRDYLPGRCLSAATLILIGGRIRTIINGGKVGVHQFSFRNPTPDVVARSQILSAKIATYINDMGISPDFMNISASKSGDDIALLDSSELERFNVVTGGQTGVVWSIQAVSGALYVRGERDSIYGHHKVLLGFFKPDGFFFHAVIEAKTREEELINFPSVEIAVDGEDIRIGISDRCQRCISGIYVEVNASISTEEAKILAFSGSFGLYIRASKDAPLFLGIAPMDTSTGRDKLTSFFEALSR